jgi:hypothetical protein
MLEWSFGIGYLSRAARIRSTLNPGNHGRLTQSIITGLARNFEKFLQKTQVKSP